MAQYQVNFYGSSYYGETNAFSGTYETADILTEEPLKNTFNVSLKALLPRATYGFNDPEVVRAGTWAVNPTGDYLRSNEVNAKLTFTATCDRIVVKYQRRPDGALMTFKLTTTTPGQASTVTDYTVDTNGALGDQEYTIANIPYGRQQLEMIMPTSGTNYFYFKSIDARVCSFTIETRARTGSGAYTAYTPITLTSTPISGDNYTITGTSPNYATHDRIQVRVWMASSDNDVTPIINELDTYAGDTNNRTEDGQYIVTIDMLSVAAAQGLTFAHVNRIDWTVTEPAGTKFTLRSRTANAAKAIWSPWSVPYKKNVNRLRLKKDKYSGYVISNLINPASINPNLRIDHWVSWDDVSYLPPDESGTTILYEFLDESSNVLCAARQPKYLTNRSLILNKVANKPYRIKMTIERRVDKASPAVEQISLISNMIYEERKFTENYGFSAVDNSNTGEQMILDMATLVFNPPAEATAPTYFLEDKTERPRDVMLYLESTNNLSSSISRPNYSSNRNDKIWARVFEDKTVKDGTITGVYKHYQYGGGSAILSQPNEVVLAPSFTPALDTSKQYRYFVHNGWFNPDKQVMTDNTVNDHISVFWKSQQTSTRTQITEQSSHNAIVKSMTDKTSDSIVIEVIESSTWGEVDWVSEEKIYFGKVNLNDEKDDYVRKHVTPESGDSVEIKYKVIEGDTYATIATKFLMEEDDIRYVNGAEVGQPLVGSTIIIPPRIVLPKINPAARVTENPYRVDIIYNSVKQGGKIVPEDRIIVGDLVIEEEEVTITKERVVRGDIAGGKDLLGNAKVTSIVGIWNSIDDPVQASVYIADTDFILDGNFIDWSPSGALSTEPAVGNAYYVTYKCMKPKTVTVTMRSDYQEQGGIDRVWRSSEVKEYSGVCAPGIDHKAELPSPATWDGASSPEIDDLTYIIEDNDLWVKTWIEYDPNTDKYYVIGSLQDHIPKENWFPYIHTGYYYIGQDEYYLFSEPITVTPSDDEIARSENVGYASGKYGNAAVFQSGSSNLIKNSGFDIATDKQVIQKIIFS